MRLSPQDLAEMLAKNPQVTISRQNRVKSAPKPNPCAEGAKQPEGAIRAKKQGRSKYRNQKTEVDGIIFDSKKESLRWQELKLLESAGEIWKLERQVTFELRVRSILICKYRPDFVYYNKSGKVVEDVKSKVTKTRGYQIKKKLMSAIYGIEILET